MKRLLYTLGLLFIASYVFGQDDVKLQDGYQVFRYPNGVVSSEGLIRNGKPEGFWRSYYVTGIKKSEGKRTNFMLDSIWVFFDQAGDTTEKISYLLGKKNGYYIKYSKDPSVGLYIASKELYAGDRKEGTAYLYFPDGKIKQTIVYNEGIKEGLSKEYDNRGRLVLTMLYENGSIVKSRVEDEPDIEIEKKFDESGKVIYAGPFRNKVPVGVHREYGKDGKVINAFVYNDIGILLSEGIIDDSGNRNGKWKDLNNAGMVIAEGQYTDNRRTGTWKFYNNSLKIEQTGSFNNGRPDGIWKWYYGDSSLLREEEYFQGQRDGPFTEYSQTGEIIAQGQYADGEKNGEWKYKSGDNTEEGKYILGLRDGIWRSYYSDGKLRYKGNYIQGTPDGQHVYYYENGRVKEEQFYRMGIRQRTWKKYSEEGTPVLTITYKDDIEVSINGVKINLPESDVKLIK